MDRLWGTMIPVPAQNVRVLHGGEQLGSLEVAYTPGHASHHVSYWHPQTGTVFAGDVAGVRIAPSEYILPPTPPPDIDLEAWQESIARLRAWNPQHLAVTHFGTHDDVGAHLDRISRGLEIVAERACTMTLEQYTEAGLEDVAAAGDAETVRAYTLGAPLDQTYAGLVRYWSKRDGGAQ
jgi:glyoxylase-like metal-dependent hydrolase (beta-lactamase superfamily II)